MSIERPVNWKYLGRKSGSNYRQLFIVGRNIAARTLYGLTFPGEEIRADWEMEEALRHPTANAIVPG